MGTSTLTWTLVGHGVSGSGVSVLTIESAAV